MVTALGTHKRFISLLVANGMLWIMLFNSKFCLLFSYDRILLRKRLSLRLRRMKSQNSSLSVGRSIRWGVECMSICKLKLCGWCFVNLSWKQVIDCKSICYNFYVIYMVISFWVSRTLLQIWKGKCRILILFWFNDVSVELLLIATCIQDQLRMRHCILELFVDA